VQSTFALLLVFVVSVIVLQVRNAMPRRWIGANLALVVGLAAYVALVTVGPSTASLGGLRIQVRDAEDRRVRRDREPRGSGVGCHALQHAAVTGRRAPPDSPR